MKETLDNEESKFFALKLVYLEKDFPLKIGEIIFEI